MFFRRLIIQSYLIQCMFNTIILSSGLNLNPHGESVRNQEPKKTYAAK